MTAHSPLTAPACLKQYFQRRNALMQTMRDTTDGGIAIIWTALETTRNSDAHFPYRHDSDFYYLTGFSEPDAALLLNANEGTSTLFCRNKDFEREIWDGYRWGPEAAAQAFGFEIAYSITDLAQMLPALLANQGILYMQLGNTIAESYIQTAYQSLRQQHRQGLLAPEHIRNVYSLLAEHLSLIHI
jgi:Xaa-Pro aminopeptidase